ncbi:receptor-like protein 9DC3 isoform X2 [Vicia villosa]|uniref:receptor-like protein 9DC3 isoform X2 n=1 Tax=Vicia villosa TaxID=3911 RepID=UPI00273C804D|nr:receptor-like protein 9DC3 isoform X2 [Vicia villosa]
MGWLLLCLHVFLFHFPSFSSSSPSFNFLCHHHENSALLQFKSSFTISTLPWCDETLMKTNTWKNGSDCCSWHGVTCDTVSGHVIGLNLGCEGLTGTLQPNSTLFHLPHLQTLNLSHNQFYDTHFHSKFGGFTSLTHLDLSSSNSYSSFQGKVPPQISHLSKLISLHLSQNFELVWKESTLKRLVQNATNLKELFLDETDMSSIKLNSIDLLFNLSSSLVTLNLRNTGLRGSFKKCNLCLPSIQQLYMSENNQLEGHQVPELSCSSNFLRILDFSGTIPQCLVSSSRLQVLDLQMNKFHGTLANKFSKDGKLFTLNLFGNRLEGRLPETLSQCQNLEVLNIGNNKLEDKFPDWLQSLQDLKVLVLRDNKLHGPISNLKINNSFPSLIIFDISGNTFSGPLPKAYIEQFETMKNVDRIIEDGTFEYIESAIYDTHESAEIDVRSNYYYSMSVTLKGINMPMVKIPKMLVSIDLSRNMFEGEIPNDIGELHSLMGLNLSHNRLVGHIPQSMGNLTNLEWLDLSSNMLIGMIPAKFTNLNSLEVLNLSNNHLVGEIPQGKQFNTFSNDSYEGNSELCGLPLSKKCGPEQQSPPASPNKLWNEEKFRFGWKPVAIGYGCGFVFGIGLGYCMFLIGRPRWLVMIFGGQPKRRVRRRRTRVRRTNGSTMNQMIQMS